MLRRLGRLAILVAFLAPFAWMGCNVNRPVIYSWPQWKRVFSKVMDDFHEAHVEFNEIVLDLEDVPIVEE